MHNSHYCHLLHVMSLSRWHNHTCTEQTKQRAHLGSGWCVSAGGWSSSSLQWRWSSPGFQLPWWRRHTALQQESVQRWLVTLSDVFVSVFTYTVIRLLHTAQMILISLIWILFVLSSVNLQTVQRSKCRNSNHCYCVLPTFIVLSEEHRARCRGLDQVIVFISLPVRLNSAASPHWWSLNELWLICASASSTQMLAQTKT